jgi:hypothetical protein
MRKYFSMFWIVLLFVLLTSSFAMGSQETVVNGAAQAKKMADKFYSWYLEPGKHRSVNDAVRAKSDLFSPTLLNRLNKDLGIRKTQTEQEID